MNLYLIERTDEIDYDEYDAFVIAAENENDAHKFCIFRAGLSSPPTCKKIGIATTDVVAGIVLGSFNAG